MTKQSDEMIERRAERLMDALDRRLMKGDLSQTEYDREVRALDAWANEEYRKLKVRSLLAE
jgi:uncharacterized membrane protein